MIPLIHPKRWARKPPSRSTKRKLMLVLFLSLILLQLIIHGSVFQSLLSSKADMEGEGWDVSRGTRSLVKLIGTRKGSDKLAESKANLVRLLQNIQSKPSSNPLPTIKSNRGKILFNPEQFRTGNRDKYLNRPTPCLGLCAISPKGNQKQQQHTLPSPGRVLQRAELNDESGNAVLTHLFQWEHGSRMILRQFVGSLRRTGFGGQILLGLPEDGAETDDWEFLKANNVTVYDVRTEPCAEHHGQDCYKGSETLPPAWGVYAMYASWLEDCSTCTGWILSSFEMNGVYFQRNPFSNLASPKRTKHSLYLAEEIAPHTDPMHGTKPIRHTRWSNQRTSLVCFPQFAKIIEEQRPVLTDPVVIGLRRSLQQYLRATIQYFHVLASHRECSTFRPKEVVNYLYYTGYYDTSATTTPWGAGTVLPLGRACSNPDHRPSNGQIDLIALDDDHGFLLNIHNNQIAPVLHSTHPCNKWIRPFFELHGRIGTTSTMIRRAIQLALQPPTNTLPMKTSYHRATVVKRASWFDRKGYCLETCCAEPIAVSIDQDADHLITAVDGFDLADVALLGHDVKDHLTLDVSYMDHAIIPCLRDGTVIYADSEAGGVIRFFEQFRPNMTKPYVLITGRTDGPEPITGRETGSRAIKDDNLLTRWYGINPCYSCGGRSPKFAPMFLGLSAHFQHQRYLYDYVAERNFGNPFSGAAKARFTESVELQTAEDTTNVLFVKFGINARSKHRQKPFDMACKNRTQTPKEVISCSNTAQTYHPSEIYEAARSYLFGLSPPGNGNDCFRTYELLYLGVIPVVLYKAELEVLFKGIPILMLKDWNLSQKELVDKMRDYVNSKEFRDSKFEGWDRLFLKHWRYRVLSDAGRLDEIVEDDLGRPYYQAWSYRPYTPPLSYKDE